MKRDSDVTTDWDGYVERFHTDRPGVTETLLGRSLDEDGRTPYDWVGQDLPEDIVLDVGCGSGPTQPDTDGWVGIDRSSTELAGARRLGRGPLVLASASILPVGDGSVDAALAVMALMVINDPSAAAADLARVLRPGGILRVLLPAARPLSVADLVRYGLLLAVLGRRAMPFPSPEAASDPGVLLTAAGFEVVADDRRRFSFDLSGRDDADLFVDSLYLPTVSVRRVRLARRLMRWTGRGDMGIPLRRVEARRRP